MGDIRTLGYAVKIAEKKVPTARGIARRAKKREEGNVEEEIDALKTKAQSFLDTLPAEKSKDSLERILPFITKMATEEEGVRQLAAIASAYLLSEAAPKIEAASEDDPQKSVDGDAELNSDTSDEIEDEARWAAIA